MSTPEKVIVAMERLAGHAGQTLTIQVERPHDIWLIRFTAGNAAVQTALSTFLAHPKIVFEPFGEELIRRNE